MLDLLYKRYANPNFILDAKIEEGLALITVAIEEDKRDKLYIQYCNQVIWMDKDNYISFEDFFDKQYGVVKLGKSSTKASGKEEGYAIANNIIENYKIE